MSKTKVAKRTVAARVRRYYLLRGRFYWARNAGERETIGEWYVMDGDGRIVESGREKTLSALAARITREQERDGITPRWRVLRPWDTVAD